MGIEKGSMYDVNDVLAIELDNVVLLSSVLTNILMINALHEEDMFKIICQEFNINIGVEGILETVNNIFQQDI